jgi:hypothetical protein
MMDADLELHTVVDAFTEFLIVAIHQILHGLKIYPRDASKIAAKYNLNVYQNA